MSDATAIKRSRTIREAILHMAYNMRLANADLGLLHKHILDGFTSGMVRYTTGELDAEIYDLVERKLLEQFNAAVMAGSIPEKAYRITAKGRDFVNAGYPFDKIEEFSL